MKEVLIVTRTKDREALLERTIRSVTQQTYTNYTHVIFNNGGDREVVERVVDGFDDDRIYILNSDKLISRSRALNEAIKSGDSKYIAILDDDDTWHSEFLERTVQALKDRELQGVVAVVDEVYEKIKKNSIKQTKKSRWMADLKVISLYQQCIDNQLSTVGFVYSRYAYQALGGYDDSLNVLEDYEYGIRFLMNYDVDLLNPGFALANYHRRVASQKIKADSSFAIDDHRYNFYKIANRLLRQEIKEGRLGVGYIMSNIKYNQSYIAQSVGRIVPKHIARLIKGRVQD